MKSKRRCGKGETGNSTSLPFRGRLWPPRLSQGLRGTFGSWRSGQEVGKSVALESGCLKEEREARFLHFLGILEKIGLLPQPEALKIGLRKNFGMKTKHQVEILLLPTHQGFFGLEDPQSSQSSLKAFGGKVVTIWLYPTQVEKKRESHFPDCINPLRMKELGEKMSIQEPGFPDLFHVHLSLPSRPHPSPGPHFCLATSQPIEMQLGQAAGLTPNWDWLLTVCASRAFIG